jgi:hypothetical protein
LASFALDATIGPGCGRVLEPLDGGTTAPEEGAKKQALERSKPSSEEVVQVVELTTGVEGDAVVEERPVLVRRQREEVVQGVEPDDGLVPRQRPTQVRADAHRGGHDHVVLGQPDDGEVLAR